MCPYHTHPEVELLRIEASEGWCLVGDELATFQPGDFFIFGPHVPHLFENHGTGGKAAAVSRYIQFRPDFLGRGFLEAPELGEVARLIQKAGRGLKLKARDAEKVEGDFSAAHEAAGLGAVTGLIALLGRLAGMRMQPVSRLAYREEQRDGGRLDRALMFMHARFRERVTLDEVAREGGLSPSAFSRLFHRRVGRTFQDYLTELRLGEVRRQLALSADTSVAEAAFASGFNNLSNFNRLFEKHQSCTPTVWRARRGGAEPPMGRSGVCLKNGYRKMRLET